MKIKKIFAFTALILGISIMCYTRFQIAETEQIYYDGNTVYSELSDRVREIRDIAKPKETIEYEVADSATPEPPITKMKKIYIPEFEINFNLLNTINHDAAAWLYCPDTVIDYPIMKAEDYNYYLYHLPDGTTNSNGSLFIDYNCAPDFSDPLTVIYGHNMKSKMMFGSLTEYKNQSYYDENPLMYLYTQQGDYRIELLYGCVIGAGQWRERAFMYKENIAALISYAAHNTTFENGLEYSEGDKIVAMSTCSYEFEDARYVLIGILRENN